jgi:hypothetical protein
MFGRMAALCVALALAACTTQNIDLQHVAEPAADGTKVAVGKVAVSEIGAAKPELERLVPYFRNALVQQLRTESGIAEVQDGAATPTPEGVVLSGNASTPRKATPGAWASAASG